MPPPPPSSHPSLLHGAPTPSLIHGGGRIHGRGVHQARARRRWPLRSTTVGGSTATTSTKRGPGGGGLSDPWRRTDPRQIYDVGWWIHAGTALILASGQIHGGSTMAVDRSTSARLRSTATTTTWIHLPALMQRLWARDELPAVGGGGAQRRPGLDLGLFCFFHFFVYFSRLTMVGSKLPR